MFGVPDQGDTETYMMQSGYLNPQLTTPTETINNNRLHEYVIDPTLYYSASTNYGYYGTGFESPTEWDDHQRAFGSDADAHYAGAQTENMLYAYYTPTYGLGETPYNPYNPFIPGAFVGVDGQYGGAQPFYVVSPHHNSSSSGYFPVPVQSSSDAVSSSSVDTYLDTVSSVANQVGSYNVKHSQASSVTLAKNSFKNGHGQLQPLTKTSGGSRVNSGTSQRALSYRDSSVGNHGPSSFGSKRGNDSGRFLPKQNQMKMTQFSGGSLSVYGSNVNGDSNWSEFNQRRSSNDLNGISDLLSEQNRGPRTNRSKNQFSVKAYTMKAGDCNLEGNIIVSADNYNKDDLPVDYVNAMFFVIKSYSEDDVHKSIKYNVWSSTPNGNKKLCNAFEEAKEMAAGRPGSCPVFLFFSVNASGQFCGVAEMVGPVDFDNDMDFWQQDKWNGNFPVKWHVIKDVPNTVFRHIILENNEHKPVTNSRDTQEIMYKPGMEILKLFKNYAAKTCLLDDFMYYENRQKIMFEERARLLSKGNAHALCSMVQATVPDVAVKDRDSSLFNGQNSIGPGKTAGLIRVLSSLDTPLEKAGDGITISSSNSVPNQSGIRANSEDMVSLLKIGTLTVNPKQQMDHKSLSVPPPPILASTTKVSSCGQLDDIVTVGSMLVKVNEHSNIRSSTGVLTVGTIPLDSKSLRPVRTDLSEKVGGRTDLSE